MCEKKQNKLHDLMYTLLYPAVLGSMIVAVVLTLTDKEIDPLRINTYFAFFLMVYFSSQHVENVGSDEGYRIAKFISDIAEIGLMFWIFALLGMVNTKYAISGSAGSTWACLYISLIATFVIPPISRFKRWRQFTNREKSLAALSGAAACVSLLALLNYVVMNSNADWVWTVWWILAVVLAVYLLLFIIFDGAGESISESIFGLSSG